MDYHVVSQGKTTIPNVDDGEECELTDVRFALQALSTFVFDINYCVMIHLMSDIILQNNYQLITWSHFTWNWFEKWTFLALNCFLFTTFTLKYYTYPEQCLLSNNIMDYYVVSQGKTSIPGVDDGEECELTDVRMSICSSSIKLYTFVNCVVWSIEWKFPK